MQLRELFVKVKLNAKDAIRDLKAINDEFKVITAQSRATRKEVKATAAEFQKSGKKASKANKETKKTTKEVGDEARETGKKVRMAGKAARVGFEDMGKGASKARARFKSFADGAKTGLTILTTGIVTAQATILGMAKSFATSGAEIELQSQQFNLTTDTVQKLQGASKLTKIEFDEITDSIKELRTKTVEAKEDGLTEFSKTLNQLGLDANSFDLLGPIDQLKLVSDRLTTLDPDVDRTTVLMRLFGEEAGVRIGPLLNKGGQHIDDLIGRFTELGGIMDKDALAKANELNTEFIEVGIVLRSVVKIVIREAAPAIKEVAGEIKKWAKNNRELRRGNLVKFIKAVVKFTKEAVPLFVDLANGVATLIDKIGGLQSTIGLLGGAFAAFKLAAIPVIGPWIAGFTLLLSLVNSYNQKLRQVAENQVQATTSAIDPLNFRETGEFVDPELKKTKLGREVLELEAQRMEIARQLEATGGKGQAVSRAEALKRETVDEFPAQTDVSIADLEQEAIDEKKLTDESERITKKIEDRLTKLRNRRIRESNRAAREAKSGKGVVATGLPPGATPADLFRQSELATKRLTGTLSGSEKKELAALEKLLGIKPPEKKGDGDGRGKGKGRRGKRKGDRDGDGKPPTLADLLGVKDAREGSRIATGQPRGLSTVIQTFNIQNTIGVPKFEININGARISNPRELGRQVVGAVDKGYSQIIVNAQRAATSQVVG